MTRKSKYDQAVDKLKAELDRLDHTQAATVEEAVANELRICNAFGMKPAGAEAYDLCPDHGVVRFRGQCSQCD